MLVQQSYGFDLGIVEKSPESFTSLGDYDAIMKKVVAEMDFQNLRYYPVGLNSSSNSLFLDISYREYLDDQKSTKEIENGFFSLDYQNVIHDDRIDYVVFKDYCFSESNTYFRDYSADGQFAVFANPERNKIVVLNLETGHVARLSGWEYVGWRKMDR